MLLSNPAPLGAHQGTLQTPLMGGEDKHKAFGRAWLKAGGFSPSLRGTKFS